MKNYFLGMVIALFAITFSSFSTTKPSKALAGEKWFELKMGGESTEADDYVLYGDGSVVPVCSGQHVCAILAEPSSGNPEIPDLNKIIATKFRANK